MNDEAMRKLFEAHRDTAHGPPVSEVRRWIDELLALLFPERADRRLESPAALERAWAALEAGLRSLLEPLRAELRRDPSELVGDFGRRVPELRSALLEDADAICAGDPAAVDRAEVIRTYPGFLAIAVYRVAHYFHGEAVPVIPRVLTEYAHERTGVDIHPGAKIGPGFCIDHGTGIVVGETTEIGRNVKLYQGVTLGALSVEKSMARTKRHPTVEDDVVIYAGATILGGDTVVGRGSVIGGSVWLLHSVPPGSRVHYDPQTVVEERPDEAG